MAIDRYNPSEIEKKWRKIWEKERIFSVDINKAKKPFYNLMMFPYPSGEGLHVGHVYAFGGSDTYGRFKRLQGEDVFEPMGFDSFGIHSENFAIKQNIHPKKLIEETTVNFREKQLKRLGALFNWDHEVITSDPDYYRWTQWLFIQLYKAGLVARKKAPVDWCPSCKTVLANEQVINGRCERCNSQVIQRDLEQWFFKITAYAEKLLNNLNKIDWSESTKTMQRNWIGRSEGAEIEFSISPQTTDHRRQQTVGRGQPTVDKIKVFTTRPDTIYGATFMVLAPEHPLSLKISSAKFFEPVKQYIAKSTLVTEVERNQAKTGVFTGAYCTNPLTKEEIPIWVADYVLMGYGTGAIMAVPAHDQRDYEFAKRYKLPIREVINGGNIQKEAYTGEGKLVNSGKFNGLTYINAIKSVSEYIELNHFGKKAINYHLRDWLISRQRYWGPPIPMIYCESCAQEGESWFTTSEAKNFRFENYKLKIKNSAAPDAAGWYPVPESNLPVTLPYLKDYQPRGKGVSPLATVPEFLKVKCPQCGNAARRETDVSDTFLDSSWYYLRYPSVGLEDAFVARQQFDSVSNPRDERLDSNRHESALVLRKPHKLGGFPASQLPWSPGLTKKWLPVDMYIGGNEHAVMHLLYSRFVTMALNDMGFIDFEEPFKKFRAHGLIIHGGAKMSKSRGNVVNPNEYMDAYGSDCLRMYLLFIGPYDLGGDFSDRAIIGIYRFLNRVWQITHQIINNNNKNASKKALGVLNKLIIKVRDDTEALKFNTAIAALMEFTNFATKNLDEIDVGIIKKFLIILSIYAPFTAEELWERAGEKKSIHTQRWPDVDEKIISEGVIAIPVQINGKLREVLQLKSKKAINKEELLNLAGRSPKLNKYLSGNKLVKTIYVPGKILNIITG